MSDKPKDKDDQPKPTIINANDSDGDSDANRLLPNQPQSGVQGMDLYSLAEQLSASPLMSQVSSLLGMAGATDADVRMAQGKVAQAEGDLEAAAEAYLDVIELDPNHYEAYVAIGQVLLYLDRPDEAENFLRKAVEINPDNASAYLYLGYVFYAQERYDACIQVFETAVEIEPENHIARNNLGFAYYMEGQLDEAAQAFVKAGDYGSERAYYNLGMVRLIQGREEDGWQAYQDAEELDPYGHQAADHVDDLKQAIEYYPEASALLTEAIERLGGSLDDEDDEDYEDDEDDEDDEDYDEDEEGDNLKQKSPQ